MRKKIWLTAFWIVAFMPLPIGIKMVRGGITRVELLAAMLLAALVSAITAGIIWLVEINNGWQDAP